jgi:predicted small lipoprotein YifL
MVRHKLMVWNLTAVAVMALGSLAACGNDTPAAQPPQTVTVTETPTQTSPPSSAASSGSSSEPERPASVRADQTARCGPTSLSGAIESGDAAAGNRYVKLAVTNTGSKACTLYGYGGLQLTNAAGAATPTKLTRKPDPAPSLVRLEPGQKAFKNLHWGAVPDGTEPVEGPCEPASAGAKVIPPDETEPFTVKFDFGSICEHGTIDGSAYYK